jgi:hypothetical protein
VTDGWMDGWMDGLMIRRVLDMYDSLPELLTWANPGGAVETVYMRKEGKFRTEQSHAKPITPSDVNRVNPDHPWDKNNSM